MAEKGILSNDELLALIKKNGGGGGGGTTNYNDLNNKPQINGTILSGNKSAEDLGLIGIEDLLYRYTMWGPGHQADWQALPASEKVKYQLVAFDDDEKSAGGGGSGELESDLTASVTVGGVTSGTTFVAGTTLEAVLRGILSPTLYPTFTAPSASMSATGSKLLEKGATLASIFTITFNRGAITPAYGTDGYRAGAASDYTLDGTTQAGNTFNVTVSESKTSYQGSVSYAAGQQPKDSNGNNYDSPYPAGTINTNTISYEFVNAIWANTANIATIAKLSLTSKSTKQRDMVFPAQTVANPEVFDIPASWTVTAVQVKNDLSGQYEDALNQFNVTSVNHDDAGGVSTAYNRYTFNMGMATGARTVRVKWS